MSQQALANASGVDINKIKRHELNKTALIGEDLEKVHAVLEPEMKTAFGNIVELNQANRTVNQANQTRTLAEPVQG